MKKIIINKRHCLGSQRSCSGRRLCSIENLCPDSAPGWKEVLKGLFDKHNWYYGWKYESMWKRTLLLDICNVWDSRIRAKSMSVSMKYDNLCPVHKYEESRCNKVSSKKHLNSRSQKYEYEL